MNMPGFSAEASVYRTREHYQSVTNQNYRGVTGVMAQILTGGGIGTGGVVPQLAKGDGIGHICLLYCYCCGRYGNRFCCSGCDLCDIILSGDLLM